MKFVQGVVLDRVKKTILLHCVHAGELAISLGQELKRNVFSLGTDNRRNTHLYGTSVRF